MDESRWSWTFLGDDHVLLIRGGFSFFFFFPERDWDLVPVILLWYYSLFSVHNHHDPHRDQRRNHERLRKRGKQWDKRKSWSKMQDGRLRPDSADVLLSRSFPGETVECSCKIVYTLLYQEKRIQGRKWEKLVSSGLNVFVSIKGRQDEEVEKWKHAKGIAFSWSCLKSFFFCFFLLLIPYINSLFLSNHSFLCREWCKMISKW